MFKQFCIYFFQYIFRAKTRQRLLFLAITGLFISSFSLLVLQCTMGGLQNNLITRSKMVLGTGSIFLKNKSSQFASMAMKYLHEKKIDAVREYEIEMLLRQGNYISPVIVHAINSKDFTPKFLEHIPLKDVILAQDLAWKLHIDLGEKVNLISPAHVSSLFMEIPKTVSVVVDEIIATEVPEIDLYHVWTRIQLIQNLIRKKEVNRIRIYSDIDFDELEEELAGHFNEKMLIKTWEDQNSTLVWALQLESIVMVFLFIAMTMLVSLCITSGLMIFFSKIRNDLASFWILGVSKDRLQKSSALFLNIITFFTVLLGLICGLIFLWLLDSYGGNIMPDIFVDRKIPVHITTQALLISFFVPYLISLLFSYFSLSQFRKDVSFLDHVRSIG